MVTKEIEEFNEDIFESMLNGTFEERSNGVEDEADTAEDFDEEDNGSNHEDTDQETEDEVDADLDQTSDGEDDEDADSETEGEEEDALVEHGDLDETDSTRTTTESEDNADTVETSDGEAQDTDKVDYKAFYDSVVNTEFVVNGKKVKGFSDPQKIIQSQQMAGGFSEKMAGFKQYRPFMAPLKERGMLEDQGKFDLAMNLLDGDKEAIKAHLKQLNIDPLDLDMDTINYSAKPSVASKESMIIDDVLDRAKNSGIEEKVRKVIGTEWDADSFTEFVNNSAVRDDLLSHIETGAYEVVQDKIAEMSRLDYNGAFGSLNTIAKYRAAVKEIQSQTPVGTKPAVAPKVVPAAVVPNKTTVNTEKAKIEQARKEAEYKTKAKEQEAKLMEQRKKASSSSKSKVGVKAKPKFDPMKVEGEELDQLMDFLITGGR